VVTGPGYVDPVPREQMAVEAAIDVVECGNYIDSPAPERIAEHVQAQALADAPCCCEACAAYRHVRGDAAVQEAWDRIARAML
jgi:hypothetical protein